MRKRIGPPLNSRQVERIPFASETQLQAVFEDEVEAMFGAKVVASTRRGGGRLFEIDILAIDGANTPIIVECKWDRIDQRAVEQLLEYRGVLKQRWRAFEQRVGVVRGKRARLKWRPPLLVAVGYRLDRPLTGVPTGMLFFTYSYHGVIGAEPVEAQVPGGVSFRGASGEGSPKDRHPKVSKKSATRSECFVLLTKRSSCGGCVVRTKRRANLRWSRRRRGIMRAAAQRNR